MQHTHSYNIPVTIKTIKQKFHKPATERTPSTAASFTAFYFVPLHDLIVLPYWITANEMIQIGIVDSNLVTVTRWNNQSYVRSGFDEV